MNIMLFPLLFIILAFFISTFLAYYFIQPNNILLIIDKPNARSLHTAPIPLMGGLAILTGLFLTTILINQYYLVLSYLDWIGISFLMIAIVSFIDDCKPISASCRLLVHLTASYLFLSQTDFWLTYLSLPDTIWILPSFLNISISILFIVWMINLYNFMDGMDGFAGGMAIFGFGSYAILGLITGHSTFMIFNLVIIGAVAGFLVFNFPPAKIFMGDLGSSSLGFFAAIFSLWAHHEDIFPFWIALLIFSPFIIDSTLTLLQRILRNEKFWQAHKSHYYQRLVQIGWGHKRTVLWEYILMAMCSISAIISYFLPVYAQWILLISWIFIYLWLIYIVNYLEKQSERPLTKVGGFKKPLKQAIKAKAF
ncbi:MAG: glycosyltransferase family 4 protein [Thiomargarita sp.]|nr:glycosyltransferase family 4 protein [Thiomargarita sp.]